MNRIEIDGAWLEIVHIAAATGTARRAPIVFLHEGLGSVSMWRDWPGTVCSASGRAGLVYSRRGYGQSSATPDFRGTPGLRNGNRSGRLLPDYLHHEARVVLPALLARLGLTRPVLLGHSDGASIALLHAAALPVTACIAMAPHVVVEDVTVQAIRQARTAFEAGDLRSRLARYHADVDCAFWQWNDIWLDPAFRAFDIRANCRHIRAPLLAIQGLEDPYGTLAQITQIDLPAGLLTRVALEACGHTPQRDQQEAVTQHIADFLAPLA